MDSILVVNAGSSSVKFQVFAAEASGPLQFVSPQWVIRQADVALDRLWWLCVAVGVGILLLAMSSVWVSLSGRGPSAAGRD